MHRYRFLLVPVLLLMLGAPDHLPAQAESHADNSRLDEPVRIGVRVVPPFVIEEPDGSYSGLTIALWEHIADELNLEYELVERDIAGLIEGVAHDGEQAVSTGDDTSSATSDTGNSRTTSAGESVQKVPLFAAASALTITSEREERVDFTHPFFITGLGIAVSHQPAGLWQAFLAIFSIEFLWVVGLLILLLLLWGLLVWVFERKHNTDEFGGSAVRGIGSGFWWAAVTMTTVGYGDKAPRTPGGRVIGFIWMFTGIILISFFTATIASSLTVTRLDTRVGGPQDLPFVRVGALEQSATLNYLDDQQIRYEVYSTIQDGLRAVSDDDIDAFVHDDPIIRYYAGGEFPNTVRVLPQTFNEQYYGIALPVDSPWRDEINRVILDYINGEEWNSLRRRYFGE